MRVPFLSTCPQNGVRDTPAGHRSRPQYRLPALCGLGILLAGITSAQALSWPQIKERFEASNPTLQAARAGIDESRAAEITAFLRPNPDFTFSVDGTQLTPYGGVYRPFAGSQFYTGLSYLHERDRKRELRRDSAKQSTAVAETQYLDQERNLLFNLRGAFVNVLQAKAVLENAQSNLAYWDRELDLFRRRFRAGDMSQIDLNRLEFQRSSFETDYTNAVVALRTAKIQILNLLNDRTPIDKFDVTGTFDYSERLTPLDEFRTSAQEARPDLKAALQSIELSEINHKLAVANSSTDPTFSFWWTHNPSFNNPYDYNTVGASISIPLRIFDRNQGEKLRTQLDINKNKRLADQTQAQIYADVDSAYYTIAETLNLLKAYKSKYIAIAEDNRTRISVAYQNGGASLLDLLDSEKAIRDARLAYIGLIGSYLTAGAQMNLAVGREVIQ